MPLAPGTLAPDFEADAHNGQKIRLSQFIGRKRVVLFFYPRDFSFFCTKEACGLRDFAVERNLLDAAFIGVSRDLPERHREFAKVHELPFPLVSDMTYKLAGMYGATSVLRSVLGQLRRVTFLIDRRGYIAHVIEGELTAKKHVDHVRDLLPKVP